MLLSIVLVEWLVISIASLLLGGAYGLPVEKSKNLLKEMFYGISEPFWTFPFKVLAIFFFFIPMAYPIPVILIFSFLIYLRDFS